MYSPVSSSRVIEVLVHLRELYRRTLPTSESEQRAFERREAGTKDLLSNLPRISEHPTLRTLLEVVDIFALTLESAHSLFGYRLDVMHQYDLQLHSGRTHIFESYPFERDVTIDLPARFASEESFAVDGFLRDLVLEWQTGVPIRALEEEGWEQPGTYYVHVGNEDSLGSSIPAGAMALVEPVGEAEKARPHPRGIYLLQFANGYRCSHCVVTRGKLRLFSTGRTYLGREEFAYPGSVRIAGRVRMFALNLPSPQNSDLASSLPGPKRGADLILPWEHHTRDRLFLTKHRRFRASNEEERYVDEFLSDRLQAKLSQRTERRYRSPTSSDPHVSILLHLALAHLARYTDALRIDGSWHSDRGCFSLETLLRASSIEEAKNAYVSAHLPTPSAVWEARIKEFGGWPSLLSARFPKLQQFENRILRLAQGCQIAGLDPMLGPGSLLLLDARSAVPEIRAEKTKAGWSRPLYVFRRGLDIFCGYLERNGNQYAILSGTSDGVKASFHADDLDRLRKVIGAAVPV